MNYKTSIAEYLYQLNQHGIVIYLKDNKIKYKDPHGMLSDDLLKELRQRKEEIHHYLFQRETPLSNVKPVTINKVNRDQMLPLSFAQQRLWFLDRYQEGNSSNYNIPVAFRLQGEINTEQLEIAFQLLIARHESLRTCFKLDANANAYQAIIDPDKMPRFIIRLEQVTSEIITERLQQESVIPFDLSRAPLMRACLFQRDTDYILFINQHHIISDAWSLGIFFKELSQIYNDLISKKSISLSPLAIQYADFAVWQRNYLQGEVISKQLTYWKETLNGFEQLQLPTDKPRPTLRTYQGKNFSFEIDIGLTQQLKALAQATHSSLFVVLLSAFYLMLNRYSDQSDLIVGSPIANRHYEQLENLIGFFINTLALRVKVDQQASIKTLIESVRDISLSAYEHQDLPFEKLVEELGIERDQSHAPLLEVMFVLQNAVQDTSFHLTGLDITPFEFEEGVAKFDLTLALGETMRGLVGVVEYNTDLYEVTTIARMVEHYQAYLSAIVINPNQAIAAIDLLVLPEYQQILWDWNATAEAYPQDKLVHQLFEEQVEKIPDHIAVRIDDQQLTYRELNHQANRLAHFLRHIHHGQINPDTLIGLCLDRSLAMIIGILGILKAGAAYVPIDPEFPQERVQYILEDTGVAFVLSLEKFAKKLTSSICQVIALDKEQFTDYSTKNPEVFNNATSLAYVIYTSGSTGKPKGAMIEHRSLVNRLVWMQQTYRFDQQCRVLQKTPFIFDVAVWELILPLICGSLQVFVIPNGHKDPVYLIDLIGQQQITQLHFVPSMLNVFINAISSTELTKLQSLKQIFCSGEALSGHIASYCKELLPQVELHNLYGPTEATIDVSHYEYQVTDNYPIVPIGKPIANTSLYVLNNNLQPVPIGGVGELYIGGDGVGRGYLNRPELTQEKFITNPFASLEDISLSCNTKLYKTGDVVRWLANGNLEYIGRNDYQVKIRGYRIELGEIEQLLNGHPAISQSVVIDVDATQDKQLCAYYLLKSGHLISIAELKNYLLNFLPAYMVPSFFMELKEFPVTINGKLDRKALPKPGQSQIILDNYFKPRNNFESQLAAIWCEVLGVTSVGIENNFFDVGGDSLKAVRLQTKINQALNFNLKVVDLFSYPTIKSLAEYVARENKSNVQEQLLTSVEGLELDDIAVIGYAGKFSGCSDIEDYWHKIKNGEDCITHLDVDDCIKLGISEQIAKQHNYVTSEGIIDGIDEFDAMFWDLSPRDAELMDPQTRRFIEHSWMALENAGYIMQREQLVVGVFAGSGSGQYLMNNILSHHDRDLFENYLLGNKDFLATRVAYHLNLKGPVFNLYTACSTSLLAITEACNHLRLKQCELALAGGVTFQYPENFGYQYQQGLISSPDGHCRAFDKTAQGTVSGSGVGIVVLKRLQEAQRDGDTILAVIKGYNVNNDGRQKVGYTAPSVQGQQSCILKAQHMAGISSDEISYVECHGTATALGDPIEVAALKAAFSANSQGLRNAPCYLGSVKANIGHVDVAAGIAGFIKVCKMLQEKIVPPQAFFQEANPALDLINTPFVINQAKQVWISSDGKPLKTGVSAFGVGGTNVHIILEEAPKQNCPLELEKAAYLLPLSAKTAASLDLSKKQLTDYLKQHSAVKLADVAYTLQQKRAVFNDRYSLVCENVSEAIEVLSKSTENFSVKTIPEIVFLCSGVGEHFINMGRGLYDNEPYYREQVRQCCEMAKPYLKEDLLMILYPEDKKPAPLSETRLVHAAVFIVNYAMAQLLMHWGIQPQAYIGHSLGEYVAACLAGVLRLEDAIALVVKRAMIIESLPDGGMLAVPMKPEDLLPLLGDELSLAAINGPALSVVSGPHDALQILKIRLEEEYIVSIALPVNHAFHSKQLMAVRTQLLALFNSVVFQVPQTPYISNVTGQLISAAEAKDPDYWCRHTCETVQFSKGIQALLKNPHRLLVEIGPGSNLLSAVLQHQTATIKLKGLVWHALRNQIQLSREHCSDYAHLLKLVGQLWQQGIAINWQQFCENEANHLADLPNYAFAKDRYWLKPNIDTLNNLSCVSDQRCAMNNWFYELLWQQSSLPKDTQQHEIKSYLIVKADQCYLAQCLIEQLSVKQQHVYSADINNYDQVFAELKAKAIKIDHVIYLGIFDAPTGGAAISFDRVAESQQKGFYGLLSLVQKIVSAQVSIKNINVITQGLYAVHGNESLQPEKATIIGLLKCIPQECPELRCRCLDFGTDVQEAKVAQQIVQELNANVKATEIAYRYQKRWVKQYQMIEKTAPVVQQVLKLQGVYLITGGLGKIGLLLADYLAKRWQAKLVLVSRKPANDATQRAICQLESDGAEVFVINADVSDEKSLELLMIQATAKYGHVDGIFHFAGAMQSEDISEIQLMDVANVERQFKVKMHALLHIANACKTLQPDFCLVASSLSPILGGLHFGAYAAANAFMDAFVEYQQAQDLSMSWMTFNMDGWEFEGEAQSLDIKPEEAFDYFDHYFSYFIRPGQVITSTHDLNHRIKTWVTFENAAIKKQSSQLYARPEMNTEYVAPQTEVEKKLLSLWQEVLGIENIGIHDCFFDLGGNSLTGTYLVSKIRQAFAAHFTIAWLISNRSIYDQASAIDREAVLNYQPLIKFHENPTGKNLFLVHPGTGGAEVYVELSKLFDKQFSVYAVESYNLYADQEMLDSIEALAKKYIEHITAIDPVGPYYLGGWSIGGIIAYEMARQLQEMHREVKQIFMLDSNVVFKDEIELHQALTSYYQKQLQINIDNGLYQFNQYWDRVQAVFIAEENMVFNYAYPVTANQNVLVFKALQSESYANGISLEEKQLLDKVNAIKQQRPANGWENIVTNLEVIDLACAHHTILDAAHIKSIAEVINQRMAN